MAEETKITLKMGVIASAVASFVIFLMGTLWNQQTRLVMLETNYGHVCETMNEMKQMLQEIRADQIDRYKKTREVYR